jgi:hypothetical protein
MELETAVRLKANIVHMVWIDGTYDMVATQEKLKYGRSSGTDFGPIDYIRYAEAFGATGLMINKPDDVAPIMKKAFDTQGPVIVGVHVDYRDNHTLFEMLQRQRPLMSCQRCRPIGASEPNPGIDGYDPAPQRSSRRHSCGDQMTRTIVYFVELTDISHCESSKAIGLLQPATPTTVVARSRTGNARPVSAG